MNIITFMQNRPRLTGVVSLAAAGSIVAAYLGKRRLDRSYPRVSIKELPKSSACRNLVESSEAVPKSVWGMEKSALLASWSGGNQTRWVPSFAALQADVPVSLLAGYGAFDSEQSNTEKDDAHHLMQNLVAAFLDARAAGPEAWFLDKEVPPLSFAPGSLLFGDQGSMGAFMLGTWSTNQKSSIQPHALGPEAPEPCSEFPSNRDAIQDSPTDTAGAVMYWKFPDGLVRTVDKAASYGLPWRFMDGGFQEFIVERGVRWNGQGDIHQC
ncbi:uncharacterized protein P174DRAFT_516539 [Aspergillus novofumigatus IBT 16806]|uniref:Uncharacterized protein n=1 Tax=Aspergillus novofumigatus (strain IBT 16806) TaxID=1392255 RepID=A0A2I1BSN7_ASPN1|nr:uncharacterized protein P174DRAFT_516636 [Aspergillus novofumigatus IBT 16806]XP_024677000.1 uncharacterized protein P174DRAFT_516539 [Aspergillus novofumigatus IBT 16806]PKX88191.1 hypothetical protein P174DRAFT_516636 [Aspergillus novofumigatus IBT 16806]PKX88405.1 hypothetical protein P174DRAFT_516539 [Aspergillus novofumigatus IBT 16806]